MKQFVFAVALLGSLSASAQSLDGVGRITLTPGWRWTPNTFFADTAEEQGYPLQRASPGGPQLTGTFAYAATPAIEVAIDLFAGYETLDLTGVDDPITSVSYGALVGVRGFWNLGSLVPYVGAAIGPTLVYTTGGLDDRSTERLTTGYAAIGGLTWRATDQLGVTFDARMLLARGLVEGVGGINAGGLWAGLGITWYFAAEPGRQGAVR